MTARDRARRRLVRAVARSSHATGDATAVALTFDDGPDPTYTPPLLDLLAELDVRATFFLVGRNAAAHPGLVTRMVAAGHTVGSHTLTHPVTRSLPAGRLWREVVDGRKSVEDAAGRPVRLFRPPAGFMNLRLASVVRAARLRPWLWTVDPRDWEPRATAAGIVASAARARAGDVVLLHDRVEGALDPAARDRAATFAAVPGLVASLRGEGLGLRGL